MKKIVLSGVFLLFLTPNIFADTLTLKSGQEIEGKVIERTDKALKVEFEGVQLIYYLDEIDKINGEKTVPLAKEAAPPVQQAAVETAAPAQQVAGTGHGVKEAVVQEAGLAVQQTTQTSRLGKAEKTTQEPAQKLSSEETKKRSFIPAMVMGGVMLVIIFFFLIFYVFFSICLQSIAKKTGEESAWLAWIPIANLFLMCRISKLSYWWLLTILGGFIPLIGVLVSLGFSAFIWYRIALVRNKPGWMGILCFIPLVNFVIIGYFAFSD